MSTKELKEHIKSNIDAINDDVFLNAIKSLIDNKRETITPDYTDENIDRHVKHIMEENHELLKRLAE